jgi:hypothetical protein
MPPNWSRGWLKRLAVVCEPLPDDPLAPTALGVPEPDIHGKTSIGRFRCDERTFSGRICHGGDAPEAEPAPAPHPLRVETW